MQGRLLLHVHHRPPRRAPYRGRGRMPLCEHTVKRHLVPAPVHDMVKFWTALVTLTLRVWLTSATLALLCAIGGVWVKLDAADVTTPASGEEIAMVAAIDALSPMALRVARFVALSAAADAAVTFAVSSAFGVRDLRSEVALMAAETAKLSLADRPPTERLCVTPAPIVSAGVGKRWRSSTVAFADVLVLGRADRGDDGGSPASSSCTNDAAAGDEGGGGDGGEAGGGMSLAASSIASPPLGHQSQARHLHHVQCVRLNFTAQKVWHWAVGVSVL